MSKRTSRPPMALRSAMILVLVLALGDGNRPTRSTLGAEPKLSSRPFVADYYYTARWGYADEFIRLFKKNHYPVLKKQIETGRILQVTVVKPRYHATEDGRWDYKVTIVFKDRDAAFAPSSDEETVKKQLYPDQETFRREEQRRFEILLAHWDVPIATVDLEQ